MGSDELGYLLRMADQELIAYMADHAPWLRMDLEADVRETHAPTLQDPMDHHN